MNITPPDVHTKWEDNDAWQQAFLLGYSQLRDYEQEEERIDLYRALGHKIT